MTGFCPRGYSCQLAQSVFPLPFIPIPITDKSNSPPFIQFEIERLLSPELAQERKEKEQGLYSNRDRDWPEESGGRGTGQFGSGAPGAAGANGRPKRDLSEILCFKVCFFAWCETRVLICLSSVDKKVIMLVNALTLLYLV